MNQELEKVGELRDQSGEVVYSLWMNSNRHNNFSAKYPGTEHGAGRNNQGKESYQDQDSYNDLMTHPQKRYLFRLLAGRGIEGEAAYQHLKKTFSVGSISQITKLDASRAIDRCSLKINGAFKGRHKFTNLNRITVSFYSTTCR